MALKPTNLLVQMGQIPPTFKGTPQELATAMVERMKIVSPASINFIFVGDVEPTSNVGPWLKNGNSWWVFDSDLKRYVPQDLTDAETKWFHMGATTPTESDPSLWMRTTKDATEADPSFGTPVGWYQWNGTAWEPYVSIVSSGATADRPASPVAFQQFYDTDIEALIWYERNQWRTVSGLPGDVKAVAFETLSEALAHNPGWDVFGASNQSIRGRWISQATKDSGVTPETDLSVGAGVAERAAFETFGETDGVQIDSSSDVPYPPTIALWHLIKL
jgi:hypothetical protein